MVWLDHNRTFVQHFPSPPVKIQIPPRLNFTRRQRQRHSGFSLIEVTMALGLMTFVSFGLLGLIPEGMNNFRKSMDYTVQAQITQELASMVQRTSYADLQGMGTSYFYDGEGTQVKSAHDPTAVYKATVAVAVDVPGLIAPVWNQGGVDQQLRAVNIQIKRVHAQEGDTGYKLMTYVADMGL